VRRTFGVALAVFASAISASAQPASTTRLIPYSGTAVDAAGSPRIGQVRAVFELFEEQEGGTPLWREAQRVATDDRGRYLVYLGSVTPLPQSAFSEERARWLAVTIDNRPLPRVMLVAVPYALRAADADTLGGQPAASFVRQRADGRLETSAGAVVDAVVDGSGTPGQLAKFTAPTIVGNSVISESATNRIGVGLTDPTGGGVVDSVFTIRNLDNNTGFGILNETQQRRLAINTMSNGGWILYDGGTTRWNPGLSQLNGRVGLGTTSPVSDFHVKSSGSPAIRIDGPVNASGEGPRLRWTEATGTFGVGFEAFLETGLNTLIFRAIDSNILLSDNILTLKRNPPSHVGVGVLDPLDKLHVAGDVRVGTGTTGCVKDADATVISGTCSSDRRLKKNIIPFSRALENVARLQPVYFHWRADEYADRHFGTGETFGLVAQDVEAVLPELVTTDEQGYKAVRYNALPLHMLQAIRELKAENDTLKERLEQQEERLRRLEQGRSK